MNPRVESPFQSIESAHDFVALLAKTIVEARRELEADIEREAKFNPSRRLDALRLALYNLEKLELNMNRSRRILNDLRTLRRLLFEERTGAPASTKSPESAHDQGTLPDTA
jgi:hypothetical protein